MANVLLVTSAAPLMAPVYTSEKRPPLGIGFLISVLRKAGHNVFFIDNYLKASNFLETDYLVRNRIDFLGIYANTICYRDTKRMFCEAQRMRDKKIWNGKIIVGGPHTAVGLETIPNFVDHVVIGEGERAILDIVEGNPDRVLIKERIRDLDELPFPSYEDFIKLPYDFTTEWFPGKPVFTMNTSRGCPFKCAFCSVYSVWGREHRCFSADRIIEEIKYLVSSHTAKGIYFREDNFTVNRRRVTDFCEQLIRQKINIKWVCETRVDTLDYDLIKLMYDAGCRTFYIGVESGSQRLLNFMEKGITIEQVEAVFRWCHKIGIKTAASFIIGAPTETTEERKMTIELAKRIKPTVSWFNVFIGIPKSRLYEYTLKNQLYRYIDDIGIVYLENHNKLVDEFQGGVPTKKIPTNLQKSRALWRRGTKKTSFKFLLKALVQNPLSLELWMFARDFLLRRIKAVLAAIAQETKE
jgi:radical SAM superfamily enzyme YgiQ (UPF0313 family)